MTPSSSAAAAMAWPPPITSPRTTGMRNVAVLERAYIGSGNVGRNTTLIRSNYVIDGNTQFFEHSMKLWEGLSHELNFNCMVSHRGQIVLATSPVQLDTYARRGNIMRLNGIDAELLDRGQVMALLPYLDYSKDARWPIWGGILQEQGRHRAPRRRGLGLCPRRRYPGRRHHRELRSDRLCHG